MLVWSVNRGTQIKLIVLSSLIVILVIYNRLIYSSHSYTPSIALSPKAITGQNLWQRNNCWSCHQIYGLGGYLGPDLTNIYSNPNKGPDYISTFLNSGVQSMPVYNFSNSEKEAIIEYLKAIDQSGVYPNKESVIEATGWVKIKYKDE